MPAHQEQLEEKNIYCRAVLRGQSALVYTQTIFISLDSVRILLDFFSDMRVCFISLINKKLEQCELEWLITGGRAFNMFDSYTTYDQELKPNLNLARSTVV